MREAAHPAVAACRFGEVEMGAGMRERCSRRYAEILEQRFADEVRRSPARLADADVQVGLAEVHRQELRVAIREVQERDFAGRVGQAIEGFRAVGGEAFPRVQRESRGDGDRQGFEKFPPRHVSSSR